MTRVGRACAIRVRSTTQRAEADVLARDSVVDADDGGARCTIRRAVHGETSRARDKTNIRWQNRNETSGSERVEDGT